MKMKKTMEHKGFSAEIRDTGPRLRGDQVFGLPQGTPIRVYYADEFINYPENWMKGQGVFVVPVESEHGLWFNWTMNDQANTAVVPTVKGCNPITGLKTSGFFLEKYEKKCPKHGCDFIAERFCEKCGYKWPDRNYQSMSPLWWDGFRADDGTVRQFFISEEMLRDVASHLIGKENTVPAFGFAFFSPKERRLVELAPNRGVPSSNTFIGHSTPCCDGLIGDYELENNSGGDNGFYHNSTINFLNANFSNTGGTKSSSFSGDMTLNSSKSSSKGGPIGPSGELKCSSGVQGYTGEKGTQGVQGKKLTKSAPRSIRAHTLKKKSGGIIIPDSAVYDNVMRSAEPKPKEVKEVSIGAGAKIRQELNPDPYPLDSWKEKPDAVMTIYFVFKEKFEELKSKGMRDISSAKEGMLQNVPVG